MTKKTIFAVLAEALIFIALLVFVWNFFDDKLDISEHNYLTARGEVSELVLKNGELISSRDSYILKVGELEEQLGVSRREVKELKKRLGASVAYIAELEMQTRVDTTIIVRDSIIYKERDRVETNFDYKDKWFRLQGSHLVDGENAFTKFNTIEVYTPLQLGVTDNYKIWVKSENPYVQFTDVTGAVIDGSKFHPKKKRVTFGVQFGVGGMYDILDKDIAIGPYGGLGVNINF